MIALAAKEFRAEPPIVGDSINERDATRMMDAILSAIRGKGFLMGESYLDRSAWFRAIQRAWVCFEDPNEFATILAVQLATARLMSFDDASSLVS